MPPYAYPIAIDYRRKKILYEETRRLEDNSLTLADLAFVGEDSFSVTIPDDDAQFSGVGYIISVTRERYETDAERAARIDRAKAYMAEYNKRHPNTETKGKNQ